MEHGTNDDRQKRGEREPEKGCQEGQKEQSCEALPLTDKIESLLHAFHNRHVAFLRNELDLDHH